MDRPSPRTLLEQLVRRSNRTIEETCLAFEKTARECGEKATLSPRHLSRWMAGDIASARPVARRVAVTYWGHDFDRLVGPPLSEAELGISGVAVAGEGDEVERRGLLRSMLIGTGAGLSGAALAQAEHVRRSMDGVLDASNVSVMTIDRWERAAREYAQSYQMVPPYQLLTEVILDFSEVQALLAQRQPVRYRQSLCHSAAEMAALAGIFLSALGHQREARAWFHTAKLAADEADDPMLAGLAVVRTATVSLYYGSAVVALEQAQLAQAILGQTPCASLVRAMVVEARALAKLGREPHHARRLIGDAETIFGHLLAGEVSDTALGFTERQFWFTTGNAYTNLRLTTEAHEVQERALRLYQPTEYLDPALIRLDQAACLVHAGYADAGCELAISTVSNAPQQHRSGLVTHYGRDFLANLPVTVQALPAAKQLRELVSADA
jgi:hypothetical protein